MVLVVGGPLSADDGAVTGCQGFSVDLSDFDGGKIDAAVADLPPTGPSSSRPRAS